MSDQLDVIKGILSDALADITPEQLVALTMEPFNEIRDGIA